MSDDPAPTETLRDKFAMAAMTGVLVSTAKTPYDSESLPTRASKFAYDIATAMLDEKARRESADG